MTDLYIPFTLKLHAFGLQRLQDPNWIGGTLFDYVKQEARKRPKGMLWKTLDNGLLYHLGLWLYHEYVLDDYESYEEYFVTEISGECRVWYLEDLIELIIHHAGIENTAYFTEANTCIKYIDQLFENDESSYFNYLDDSGVDQIIELYRQLRDGNIDLLKSLAPVYAVDYADRVFHDRELCMYISQVLVTIGFDGTSGDEEPKQWVEREAWPEWAKTALRARERGKCANCGKDLIQELEDDVHIDHIIPISKGGCNDLVNLQILCAQCNLAKKARTEQVKSSIPPYMKRRLLK